ncbi:MAG: futalosine hydrolase [Firmicutes bacterium]|nr:futalosine hydrolase [Bacillota bacterium]
MDLKIKEGRKRILIITAVSAEKDAVLRGLHNNSRFKVLEAGVGPIASAVSTTRALVENHYDMVVSAGIAGGFPGKAEVGSLVVANKIVAADLGVETPEGFSSLDELGFGSIEVQVDTSLVNKVTDTFLAANIPVITGPVITVSTATGTETTALKLASRVPGAVAEAMEGYGVALAAHNYGLPILEIRAISNLVGPRDKSTWQIKKALSTLETASKELTGVLL